MKPRPKYYVFRSRNVFVCLSLHRALAYENDTLGSHRCAGRGFVHVPPCRPCPVAELSCKAFLFLVPIGKQTTRSLTSVWHAHSSRWFGYRHDSSDHKSTCRIEVRLDSTMLYWPTQIDVSVSAVFSVNF